MDRVVYMNNYTRTSTPPQNCVSEILNQFPHLTSDDARKTLLAHGGAEGLEDAIAYLQF